MKLKIEVKAENNYLPPHTHTQLGGGGLFDLLCTQGQLLMDWKLLNGATKYQKFLLFPKITYLDYIKIAWCPWQPIGHCSKQGQDQYLLATPIFMDFFLSLLLIQEIQAVSYWRNKMIAK